MDWEEHAAHRRLVAEDQGQWVGLADENGVPFMDLPPTIDLIAPETRLSPESLKLSIGVRSRLGVVNPVVDDLVAEGLGRVDAQGRLILITDPSRFIVVERPTVPRRAFKVTHCVPDSSSSTAPSTMAIHGTDMLRMLSGVPGMSAPTTWTGQWHRFTRDWAGPEGASVTFSKPRDLQDMKMVTVADGATIEGPAEATIRRLITESLTAAFRTIGITEDPPLQVVQEGTGKDSPHVLLRPTDKPLWDEINAVALASGVRIAARMWWPGDAQPPGMTLVQPTNVITVEQVQEVI